MTDYHAINMAYEKMLSDEWERYNEEGPEFEYDPYAEAEARWESMNER